MGFPKKHQMEVSNDSECKKWVIGGIAIRAPLKPISVKNTREEGNEDEETNSTTPTACESKIPEKLACPPPPRKRRPAASTCHYNGVTEFFNPPDLESVFMCHAGRAN